MNNDHIDASIGLTVSLHIFKRLKRSGMLQATISRIPSIKGPCKAFLLIEDGNVTTCYAEDQNGKRHAITKEVLCRLDDERGPYEWNFQPKTISTETGRQSSPLSPNLIPTNINPIPTQDTVTQTSPSQQSQPILSDTLIPSIIAQPAWERLSHWSPQQQQMLYLVLVAIDGKRSIRDLQSHVPLPPHVINEAISILLRMQTIILLP